MRYSIVTARAASTPTLQGPGRASLPTLQPNDLWWADRNGSFMLAGHRYCHPLTITDFASQYLIACAALAGMREHTAFDVFERTF
jgi:hypothetical protein